MAHFKLLSPLVVFSCLTFTELRIQLEEVQSAKEDRKVIELRAAEVRKAKAKATPAMLKRLIQKLVSAITISSEGASMGYWQAKDGAPDNPSTEKQKALDQKSGAYSVVPLGLRRLEKIQDFFNLPPLPGDLVTKQVVGGYIFKNGGH